MQTTVTGRARSTKLEQTFICLLSTSFNCFINVSFLTHLGIRPRLWNQGLMEALCLLSKNAGRVWQENSPKIYILKRDTFSAINGNH